MNSTDLIIKNILVKYKKILKSAGFESYSLDCEILLMYTANLTKVQLYTNFNHSLNLNQFIKFKSYIKRRLNNEPIQYIINNCEFMGLSFFVNKNTLIPREDTEVLVEKTIHLIKENNLKNILDIGTGSGSIAVSIANYCPNCEVTAIDINPKTLEVAKNNAKLNNVNINFLQSNLFENLYDKFDLIVSNPPYIKKSEIKNLAPNVKCYEPHLALDGGEDGLNFYNKIIKSAHYFLNKNGYLIFEIGFDQANQVYSIFKKYDFINIKLLKDLNGLDRVIYANL